ncbi:CSN-associated deubiquitinating enzyme Ubp12, partial [Rhizophlyctis rosea]
STAQPLKTVAVNKAKLKGQLQRKANLIERGAQVKGQREVRKKKGVLAEYICNWFAYGRQPTNLIASFRNVVQAFRARAKQDSSRDGEVYEYVIEWLRDGERAVLPVVKAVRSDKIEALVEALVNGLDLEDVVIGPHREQLVYDLFAVSNDFGEFGGGYYPTYAKNLLDERRYGFDDRSVGRGEEGLFLRPTPHTSSSSNGRKASTHDSLQFIVEKLKKPPTDT